MNLTTELVFILDRSGSMAGLESDTIGGFNAMLAKQKQQEGACYVSTVLFDNDSTVLHDRIPLEQVPPMTEHDYTVGGCTALLDALGGAIRHVENIHRYIRAEDVPEKTVFVITTDGMENASRRYRADEVRRMIKQKEHDGWEFLFLTANIDAVRTAQRYGIAPKNAVNYHADRRGTRAVYESVSEAVGCLRSHSPLREDWSDAVAKDFASRDKEPR